MVIAICDRKGAYILKARGCNEEVLSKLQVKSSNKCINMINILKSIILEVIGDVRELFPYVLNSEARL